MKAGALVLLGLVVAGGCGGSVAVSMSGGDGGSVNDATIGSGSGALVLPPSTPCASTGLACPPPPPDCADSHTAILYGGTCTSGFCKWQASTYDCSAFDASCIGAARADAGFDVPAVDGSAWINGEGCLLGAPVGGAPLAASCDADASPGVIVCPPAPSTCLDSRWLVYYDDGQCVGGQCEWQQRDHFCTGGCRASACAPIATTAPPPPCTTQ